MAAADGAQVEHRTAHHVEQRADARDVSPGVVDCRRQRGGQIAQAVAAGRRAGKPVLVAGGTCDAVPGVVGGLQQAHGPEARIGLVWFDAHADFDTPDRSLGFFDGMGLAILTGNGWELLRQTIPGFMPVDERDVVLVGARDLEEHQRAPLDASAMRILPGPSFDSTGFLHALDELRQRASRTYLHIDLDVLDTSEGRANRFAAAGGLSAQQLEWAVEMVFRRSAVAAAALTAYARSQDRIGVITFAAADSQRRYGPGDLALVEELARRHVVSGCGGGAGGDAAHSGELGQARDVDLPGGRGGPAPGRVGGHDPRHHGPLPVKCSFEYTRSVLTRWRLTSVRGHMRDCRRCLTRREMTVPEWLSKLATPSWSSNPAIMFIPRDR